MASEGVLTGPNARALLLGAGLVALLQAAFELAPFRLSHVSHLWLLAALRLAQVLAVIWAARSCGSGWESLGLSRKSLLSGFYGGVKWCFGFGAFVALCMLILHEAGGDPFFMFRQPLKADGPVSLASYIFIGSVVAGVSEEIFFRGLIYGYLRRFGLVLALIASTALFIAPHYLASGGAAPFFQGAGGLIFAISYEREKSLVTPVMIHAGGNLAMFLLTAYFSGQLF